MLRSDQVEALFAVSASVIAVLKAEARIELTVDWDSAGSGEAVVMPEHLELVVVDFGLAVEFVKGQVQLEVLEWPGWTELVTQPLIPVTPLVCDYQIGASV